MTLEKNLQTVATVVATHQHLPGALLPILHAVQHELGYIPADTVPAIAKALNLSKAEVHGVITYYHHFRSEPAGQHVVQICRAEACQSMGAEQLWAHACVRLGLHGDHPGTTADGAVTLEPVYCLGLCSSSPAMVVDDKVHARVSISKFDRLVAQARSAA
ncbi:formate dehydrogenase subunit gamma [Rhodoferax sp.]|uniref:formate dehydrogenase subunit gamma n=1 Tax=Rhodoferax sp. TaxID=50421 RepID=UPI0025DDC066|nr:formate dehydrogenase subunit gamma [Rhodoferax sp.]